MRILIMNCSPVRNGATAEIARLAGEFLAEGNQVKRVCIDDYSIGLCRGCRSCHTTARCVLNDDVPRLMEEFEWADCVLAVSPSYWADIPGQFKVFIDRCTPWCNTHEPHASLSGGKKGYSIALRTGMNPKECERVIGSIEHFYGHLEIAPAGSLSLCAVSGREDVAARISEIEAFCGRVRENG